jgi:hypothetical protein
LFAKVVSTFVIDVLLLAELMGEEEGVVVNVYMESH